MSDVYADPVAREDRLRQEGIILTIARFAAQELRRLLPVLLLAKQLDVIEEEVGNPGCAVQVSTAVDAVEAEI